MPNHICWVIYK